ncbi:hypothetical protein Hanom_Chr04g00372041 [Helianthus anomalus]
MKYGIKSLTYYKTPDQIRKALEHNFCDEGPKYPIIASCYMDDFPLISARKATARLHFERKYPVKEVDDPRRHCVVITGISVAFAKTKKLQFKLETSMAIVGEIGEKVG